MLVRSGLIFNFYIYLFICVGGGTRVLGDESVEVRGQLAGAVLSFRSVGSRDEPPSSGLVQAPVRAEQASRGLKLDF